MRRRPRPRCTTAPLFRGPPELSYGFFPLSLFPSNLPDNIPLPLVLSCPLHGRSAAADRRSDSGTTAPLSSPYPLQYSLTTTTKPPSPPFFPGTPLRSKPAMADTILRRGRGPTRLRPPLDVLTGGSGRGAVPRARRCAGHPQQRPWSPGTSSASPPLFLRHGRPREEEGGRPVDRRPHRSASADVSSRTHSG